MEDGEGLLETSWICCAYIVWLLTVLIMRSSHLPKGYTFGKKGYHAWLLLDSLGFKAHRSHLRLATIASRITLQVSKHHFFLVPSLTTHTLPLVRNGAFSKLWKYCGCVKLLNSTVVLDTVNIKSTVKALRRVLCYNNVWMYLTSEILIKNCCYQCTTTLSPEAFKSTA